MTSVAENRPTRLRVDQLFPNGFNPNTLSPKKFKGLREHLRRDPDQQRPILCRPMGDSFEIVDGEQTWRAATEAGMKDVAVKIVDVDDYEARRLCVVATHTGVSDRLKCGRLLRQMLEAAPGKTNKDLAQDLGVSDGTVGNKLAYTEFADLHPEISEDAIAKMPVRKLMAGLGRRLGPAQAEKTLTISINYTSAVSSIFRVEVRSALTELSDASHELIDLISSTDPEDHAAMSEIGPFAALIRAPGSSETQRTGELNFNGGYHILLWAERHGRKVIFEESFIRSLRAALEIHKEYSGPVAAIVQWAALRESDSLL